MEHQADGNGTCWRSSGCAISFAYDLTSIAFAGNRANNPAVTYGYSRDHRPDLKQRGVALNVRERHGVPVVYQLLAENTADCTTSEDNPKRLRTFLDRFPEPSLWMVLVSDRADQQRAAGPGLSPVDLSARSPG